MPIRGVIFLAIMAIAIAAIRKDRIYSWVEYWFDEEPKEKEKENKEE